MISRLAAARRRGTHVDASCGAPLAGLEITMRRSAVVVVVLMILGGGEAARADEQGAGGAADATASGAGGEAARPAALTPLLASYVALQALDISSTYVTARTGAYEANPVVRQALDSPVALVAMKAGSAALTVAFAHHLSKRHPKAAVLLMIGMNSAYAVIVAHNYSVAR
jgi:hypothetical protein